MAYQINWIGPNGPYGGSVSSLVASFEPSKVIVYSASNYRGVVKSNDGGLTWTFPPNRNDNPAIIKFNPKNPKTIAAACYFAPGPLMSTNEGASWQHIGNACTVDAITNICFNSITPEIMYATVNDFQGIYRIDLRDPTPSWRCIGLSSIQNFHSIAHDPVSKKLYTGWVNTYSTSNEGQSWETLPMTYSKVLGTYRLSSTRSAIYFEDYLNSNLLVSTDEGKTFSILENFSYKKYGNFLLHPVDATREVFALDLNASGKMVKTADYGRTWSPAFVGLPNEVSYSPAYMLLDQFGNLKYVFATTAGFGNYISDNGGNSWSEMNGQSDASQRNGESFANTNVRSIAVDDNGWVYAGTDGAGIFRSVDSGETWSRANENIYGTRYVQSLDVGRSSTPNVVYAATKTGAFKSVDGAGTWMPISYGLTNLNVRAIAAGRAGVYAGTLGGGVFTGSPDPLYPGVGSWAPLPSMGDSNITALCLVSPESKTLYAGTLNGGIYRYPGSGSTWEVLEFPGPGGAFGDDQVNCLSVDPRDRRIVYAGISSTIESGLYFTTNEGSTWAAAPSVGNNVYAIYIDSFMLPSMVYVGGDAGIIRSQDRSTWENIGSGKFDYVYSIARNEKKSPNFYASNRYKGVLTGLADIAPPAAPTDFRGAVRSTTSITWKWTNNATNEYGYEFVELAPDSGITYLPARSDIYTEEALAPNTVYTREVAAYNVAESFSDPSNECTLAAAPTNLRVVAPGPGGDYAWLDWDVNGDPLGTTFVVEISSLETGPFSSYVTYEVYPPSSVEGLTPQNKYWFRVRGLNRKGINTEATNVVSVETTHETRGPRIYYIKFDGLALMDEDVIRPNPLITAYVTDESTSPEAPSAISKESLSISFSDHYVVQGKDIDSFVFSPTEAAYLLSHRLKSPLGSGKYLFIISASDVLENPGSSQPRHVRVVGGGVDVVGQVLTTPTPFKPATEGGMATIAYTLSTDAPVDIYMYDIAGKIVLRRKFEASTNGGRTGYNEIKWNGTSDFGKVVGNGIYVFKIISKKKVIGKGKIVVYD